MSTVTSLFQTQIDRLNPETDHCQIVCLFLEDGMLWDVVRSLELALFRTFAVPSISQLLDKTQQFEVYGQKRYDDTTMILLSILREGYDSPIGQRALSRMNKTHAHFNISNDDYRFVLSTFVLDPLDWLAQFAWRPVSEKEQQSLFLFWKNVGQRMGITELPQTLAEMRQQSQAFAEAHFHYAPCNQRVAEATLRILQGWLPKPLHAHVKPATCALLDDTTLRAFGFSRPSPVFTRMVHGSLRARARLLRMSAHLRKSTWPDGKLSYPQGYQIEHLAPESLLKTEQRTRSKPQS